MKKIITFLLMASCTGQGSHAAASEPGYAYRESLFSAYHSYLFAKCRDLTDEEMDDADNRPGGGYSDGKWTGENPPQGEDEDGNPTYAAQQVWEDDDGEITEVPA